MCRPRELFELITHTCMFMIILKNWKERKRRKELRKFFLSLFRKSNIASVGYQVTYETVPVQEFGVKSLIFSFILKFIIFRRKKNSYLKFFFEISRASQFRIFDGC